MAFVGSACATFAIYGAVTGRADLETVQAALRYGWLEAVDAKDMAMPIVRDAIDHALEGTSFQLPQDDDVATTTPAPEPVAPIVYGPPAPTQKFERERVLSDSLNRLNLDFRVTPGLHDRVAFWFDVYTKYDSDKRIIHDSRRPWIVYEVVDVAPILYAETPRRRWLRNMAADHRVHAETARVRAALAKLAKTGAIESLPVSERPLVAPLRTLAGSLARNARLALGEVRVQTGQRDFFISGLASSPRYLGTMERIFAAHGLPRELTRLPFVESSFNKAATSKVGASGIWQLMGGTGAKFLIVGSSIDERRSPYKATDAAARLLKENHLILYRSWPLAVTAWNHGPGGVRKAIAGAGSRDLATILERYRTRHFDFASSNFYCEFLAALHAETYKDVVFSRVETDPVLDSYFISLPRSLRPSELMRLTGLKKAEFTSLNPDLENAVRRNAAVPRGYRMHIPSGLKEAVEAALRGGSTASQPFATPLSRAARPRERT